MYILILMMTVVDEVTAAVQQRMAEDPTDRRLHFALYNLTEIKWMIASD
jgi:hypothetical protein